MILYALRSGNSYGIVRAEDAPRALAMMALLELRAFGEVEPKDELDDVQPETLNEYAAGWTIVGQLTEAGNEGVLATWWSMDPSSLIDVRPPEPQADGVIGPGGSKFKGHKPA